MMKTVLCHSERKCQVLAKLITYNYMHICACAHCYIYVCKYVANVKSYCIPKTAFPSS